MQSAIRLQDMTIEQLKAALAADRHYISDDQLLAIRDFVWKVGGIQNARLAVEVLGRINRAA